MFYHKFDDVAPPREVNRDIAEDHCTQDPFWACLGAGLMIAKLNSVQTVDWL